MYRWGTLDFSCFEGFSRTHFLFSWQKFYHWTIKVNPYRSAPSVVPSLLKKRINTPIVFQLSLTRPFTPFWLPPEPYKLASSSYLHRDSNNYAFSLLLIYRMFTQGIKTVTSWRRSSLLCFRRTFPQFPCILLDYSLLTKRRLTPLFRGWSEIACVHPVKGDGFWETHLSTLLLELR